LRREKNKKMTTSQGGSSSSATSKKKKTDENEPPSSLSFFTPKKKIKWWWAKRLIAISCRNLVRIVKDENKWNIHNRLLCKRTRVKKKQRKKKVDVDLLATYALVIFWRRVFCNTILATSFAALLQHRFCYIASTLPLQHYILSIISTSLL
jgi:hypothetical protein